MSDLIKVERIDSIVKLSLNRPEVRNAQNRELINTLDVKLKEADSDKEIRVIVIAGAGPSFSSGHDLLEVSRDKQEILERSTLEGRWDKEKDLYYNKCLNIRNLRKPTIAQVHGHCIAAGWMLACMCDLIIAAEGTRFSDPVLEYAATAVELLFHPWEIGFRQAKELLFTGGSITAERAYELGMVNRVVSMNKLDEEVITVAKRISKMQRVAV